MVQRGRGNMTYASALTDIDFCIMMIVAIQSHWHNVTMHFQNTSTTNICKEQRTLACIIHAYDSDSNPQVIVFIQTNDRLGMALRVQNLHKFSGG